MNCCEFLLQLQASLQQILDDETPYTIEEIKDKIQNQINVIETELTNHNCKEE